MSRPNVWTRARATSTRAALSVGIVPTVALKRGMTVEIDGVLVRIVSAKIKDGKPVIEAEVIQ